MPVTADEKCTDYSRLLEDLLLFCHTGRSQAQTTRGHLNLARYRDETKQSSSSWEGQSVSRSAVSLRRVLRKTGVFTRASLLSNGVHRLLKTSCPMTLPNALIIFSVDNFSTDNRFKERNGTKCRVTWLPSTYTLALKILSALWFSYALKLTILFQLFICLVLSRTSVQMTW